jgi:hypothetical protein
LKWLHKVIAWHGQIWRDTTLSFSGTKKPIACPNGTQQGSAVMACIALSTLTQEVVFVHDYSGS